MGAAGVGEPGGQPWSKWNSKKNPGRFIPCLSFPFSESLALGAAIPASASRGHAEPRSGTGRRKSRRGPCPPQVIKQSAGFLSSLSIGGVVVSSLT